MARELFARAPRVTRPFVPSIPKPSTSRPIGRRPRRRHRPLPECIDSLWVAPPDAAVVEVVAGSDAALLLLRRPMPAPPALPRLPQMPRQPLDEEAAVDVGVAAVDAAQADCSLGNIPSGSQWMDRAILSR